MTSPVAGAFREAVAGSQAPSIDAKRVFEDLMGLDPVLRREFYRPLMGTPEFARVVLEAKRAMGSAYALWEDDPVGFVRDVLNETSWSKQDEVMVSVAENQQTAVPSAVGTGKTHIGARLVIWRSVVYPAGTSKTVTTATRFRQVQRQMWPHIRTLVKASGLPLHADQTQMRAPDHHGVMQDVAYGFSAPAHDESAMQGIHEPKLFLVVDEGGGISIMVGNSIRSLMTGDDTRLLVIGNPPTDDEGSWFEQLCNRVAVNVVRISAYDAPQYTGEVTGRCMTCPRVVPRHPLSKHIVDPDWVQGAIDDFGADSNYVTAKVKAQFPKGGPSRIIPSDWIDLCRESPEPEGPEYVRVSDVVLDAEEWMVKRGAWVRLGVDVAADGGDELAISRAVGDLVTLRHTSSGAPNANSVHVAGVILNEIEQAETLARALNEGLLHDHGAHIDCTVECPAFLPQVEVKIDVIGVGHGVFGTLVAWGTEGMHGAKIVPVDVRENTYRNDEDKQMRPARKRDEMWIAGRTLMQPRATDDTGTGVGVRRGLLRVRVDDQTAAQLGGPKYTTNSAGQTVIESKDSMRKRGLRSPDRAESFLMAVYQPKVKKGGGFALISGFDG